MKSISSRRFFYTFLPPLFLFFLNPFALSTNQQIVLCSLLLCVIWWAGGFIRREIANAFLLLIFVLFGNSPLPVVFNALGSPTFYTIFFAYLLTAGLCRSQATNLIVHKVIYRFAKTPFRLLVLALAINQLLAFLIPQPFARVLLIISIYKAFLEPRTADKQLKEILFFSVCVFGTTTSMMMLTGDLVLNPSLIAFTGNELSYLEYLKVFWLPSLMCSLCYLGLLALMYRKKLFHTTFSPLPAETEEQPGKQAGRALLIIAVVILLWLSEPLHHVGLPWVALLGVIVMTLCRMITWEDVKNNNYELLLFIIAIFSIGPVLKNTGITDAIMARVYPLMPDPASPLFLLSIMALIVLTHMVIGSPTASSSISLPAAIELCQGVYSPLLLGCLAITLVSVHYFFPFHQMVLMVGADEFSRKKVLAFGALSTVLVFALPLLVYLPWWRLLGIS